MPSPPFTVLVTGANKGIGFAIVKELCSQLPSSPIARQSGANHFLIYLTARSPQRGEDALDRLEGDSSLRQALKKHGGPVDLRFRELDISKPESITSIAKFISHEHPEGLDVLIQNAGIATKGSRFDAQVVDETLTTNYDGTRLLAEALLPQIKPDGRMVMVSSMAGNLRSVSTDLANRFRDAKSVEAVSELIQEFRDHVDKGDYREAGWPSAAYSVSKMGVNALTRSLAFQESSKGGNRLISCCCPGWIKTDMTSNRGPGTTEEGADTPVWLAIGDIDFTGQYVKDRKPQAW